MKLERRPKEKGKVGGEQMRGKYSYKLKDEKKTPKTKTKPTHG